MLAIVNETLEAGQTATIHKFERAGLGRSPYRFDCVTEKVYVSHPGATPVAGSSCDYCGTGIRYEFWCVAADGNRFKVGCDCIHKSGDAGLIKLISAAERKLRDAKNAAAKERKAARLEARVAAAVAILPTVRGRLAANPHPSPYFAKEGRTQLDYVNWCLENRAGEKAAIYIEMAAKA